MAVELIEMICDECPIPKRDSSLPFVYLIDHCFAVKGQGTVVTGTVIQGKISKGDTIEIPEVETKTKIKSMQVFRNSVNSAQKGDRVGMLLNNLSPD